MFGSSKLMSNLDTFGKIFSPLWLLLPQRNTDYPSYVSEKKCTMYLVNSAESYSQIPIFRIIFFLFQKLVKNENKRKPGYS